MTTITRWRSNHNLLFSHNKSEGKKKKVYWSQGILGDGRTSISCSEQNTVSMTLIGRVFFFFHSQVLMGKLLFCCSNWSLVLMKFTLSCFSTMVKYHSFIFSLTNSGACLLSKKYAVNTKCYQIITQIYLSRTCLNMWTRYFFFSPFGITFHNLEMQSDTSGDLISLSLSSKQCGLRLKV